MTDSLAERVAALEAAVADLQGTRSATFPPPEVDDPFWLVREIRTRHPEGAVTFGGTATVGDGEVEWQWGELSDNVRDRDWGASAAIFDALSHPVRLRLLQQVLNGTTTTAELAEDAAMGTTGQLHHHLRALVAAGWLQSTGRAHWAVAPQRVIPLLVVISASTN